MAAIKRLGRMTLGFAAAICCAVHPHSADGFAVTGPSTEFLTGEHAPGTAGDFDSFGRPGDALSSPAIANKGTTAFVASISHQGGSANDSNDFGLWSNGHGALRLLAREGDEAVGAPSGVTFATFLDPVHNDLGQTAFHAYSHGGGNGGTDGEGIWTERNGNLELVARSGEIAPGTASATFYQFDGPLMNRSGQIAFYAALYPLGPDTSLRTGGGIWAERDGHLKLIVRAGDQAPGLPAGIQFWGMNPPVMNSQGKIAFYTELWPLQTGVNPENSTGIWSEGSGSLALVAYAGMAAPGIEPGAKFSVFSNPVINVSGHVVFNAGLYVGPGGITVDNATGIWSNKSGQLTPVLRGGQDAAGTSEGTKYSYFTDADFNNAGDIALSAKLATNFGIVDESNNSGIWIERNGNVQLIAREGDVVPGVADASVFEDFASGLANPSLNGRGKFAFAGMLRMDGSRVTESNNDGIWAQDRNGVLRLIVREGAVLESATGPRIVASISFSSFGNEEDGGHVSFNNQGQLAFYATFADGSSATIISNIANVPEPTTFVLGVGAFVYCHRRAIRRRVPIRYVDI